MLLLMMVMTVMFRRCLEGDAVSTPHDTRRTDVVNRLLIFWHQAYANGAKNPERTPRFNNNNGRREETQRHKVITERHVKVRSHSLANTAPV